MKARLNSILSILMLVFFIPASLGFTLIKHHCITCHVNYVETSFLLSAHNHNGDDCLCKKDYSEQECTYGNPQNDKDLNKQSTVNHKHSCDTELKKLELPFTVPSLDNNLPLPLLNKIFAAILITTHNFEVKSSVKYYTKKTSSPTLVLSGYDLLILKEVFRL